MRPRSLLDQVQTILGRVGWQAVSSDKGAFAQRAADLFGGFLPLRDSLVSPDLEALFTVFLSGKREQAPGRWISAEKRRVLTLADVNAIYGNRDQAEALIEGLRAREAVQIGSVLKCRRCRQESWYDIDAFGRSFVCSRCRLSQPADSASWRAVEPVWSYRLDEALLQFLVHRGDLPVIAAAAIADPNGPPTEATFELEVRSTDSSALDGKPLEIDIVLGQGPHLTIGEASVKEVLRTAKAKEGERFQTLAELSNRLAARRFLLANAGTWSRRTRETAERAISGPWLSLRVLEQVPMVRRPDNLLADPE
jgi:hypothetical protein